MKHKVLFLFILCIHHHFIDVLAQAPFPFTSPTAPVPLPVSLGDRSKAFIELTNQISQIETLSYKIKERNKAYNEILLDEKEKMKRLNSIKSWEQEFHEKYTAFPISNMTMSKESILFSDLRNGSIPFVASDETFDKLVDIAFTTVGEEKAFQMPLLNIDINYCKASQKPSAKLLHALYLGVELYMESDNFPLIFKLFCWCVAASSDKSERLKQVWGKYVSALSEKKISLRTLIAASLLPRDLFKDSDIIKILSCLKEEEHVNPAILLTFFTRLTNDSIFFSFSFFLFLFFFFSFSLFSMIYCFNFKYYFLLKIKLHHYH